MIFGVYMVTGPPCASYLYRSSTLAKHRALHSVIYGTPTPPSVSEVSLFDEKSLAHHQRLFVASAAVQRCILCSTSVGLVTWLLTLQVCCKWCRDVVYYPSKCACVPATLTLAAEQQAVPIPSSVTACCSYVTVYNTRALRQPQSARHHTETPPARSNANITFCSEYSVSISKQLQHKIKQHSTTLSQR